MPLFQTRSTQAMLVAVLGLGAAASASPIVQSFSGSHALGHAAQTSFTFDTTSKTVAIRIANMTPATHAGIESRALTGLFWDMSPASFPWLSVTATHGPVINPHPGGAYTPTQLWAFRDNLPMSKASGPQQFGLSAAGFDLFSSSQMLEPGGPHPQPSGLNGGILSSSATPYPANNKMRPMFDGFIEFTFALPAAWFNQGPDNIQVSNVWFQFGTGFNEPGFNGPPDVPPPPVIPLPLAGLSAGAGLLLIATRRRRPLA